MEDGFGVMLLLSQLDASLDQRPAYAKPPVLWIDSQEADLRTVEAERRERAESLWAEG